jgi:hypothetical protein
MKTVTYEDALRALNEAVKAKGYDYQYPVGDAGGCWNVTETGEPDCIVGWALVWLGVPAEWFLEGARDDRRGMGAVSVCPLLRNTGVLDITDEAFALFRDAQARQDGGIEWGRSVVQSHLGNDEFQRLDLLSPVR